MEEESESEVLIRTFTPYMNLTLVNVHSGVEGLIRSIAKDSEDGNLIAKVLVLKLDVFGRIVDKVPEVWNLERIIKVEKGRIYYAENKDPME